MITAAAQLHLSVTGITSLPTHLASQFPSLSKRGIIWAFESLVELVVADCACLCIAFRTHSSIRTRLDTTRDKEGGTVVVATVRFVLRSIFHTRDLKRSQFV